MLKRRNQLLTYLEQRVLTKQLIYWILTWTNRRQKIMICLAWVLALFQAIRVRHLVLISCHKELHHNNKLQHPWMIFLEIWIFSFIMKNRNKEWVESIVFTNLIAMIEKIYELCLLSKTEYSLLLSRKVVTNFIEKYTR